MAGRVTGKVLYRPLCGHWSETAFEEVSQDRYRDGFDPLMQAVTAVAQFGEATSAL
jgi:hypothetical protein